VQIPVELQFIAVAVVVAPRVLPESSIIKESPVNITFAPESKPLDDPPVALMVTFPVPPVGDTVIFEPAMICVTLPPEPPHPEPVLLMTPAVLICKHELPDVDAAPES
jgi:hypothetical protein